MRRSVDFPWTAGVALLALAASGASFVGGAAGRFVDGHLAAASGAIRAGALWRLFTGPLVHSSFGQLARDGIGFALLGASYEAELGRRYLRLLACGLGLPVLVEVLAHRRLAAYYGLSGAVYALLAFAVAYEWRHAVGRPPRWVISLAVVSLLKLGWETATGRLLIPMELGDGVRPATLAHLTGVLVGLAHAAPWRRAIENAAEVNG